MGQRHVKGGASRGRPEQILKNSVNSVNSVERRRQLVRHSFSEGGSTEASVYYVMQKKLQKSSKEFSPRVS
jgi:hypothetical protein